MIKRGDLVYTETIGFDPDVNPFQVYKVRYVKTTTYDFTYILLYGLEHTSFNAELFKRLEDDL